ncbi:hypothetical protein [Aeoliella sp. SH292]|uniref:hypothetical protein n=1 Tax=Aeoliella sp. SH292 TaxID=3454464 RepID=UPI003F956F18
MTTTAPQHIEFFPRWFRALVITVAVIMMCACQSASKITPKGYSAVGAHTAAAEPASMPVRQAQYTSTSKGWLNEVEAESQPYHGEVPPCSCHGCQSGSSSAPAEQLPTVHQTNYPPMEEQYPAAEEPYPPTGAACPPMQAPYPMQAPCPPMGGLPCNNGCQSCGLIGPSDEYLCDGGDFQTPAGVDHDWRLHGVEQEDTITHYDTLDGRVIVKPSNRVCIYAPRFGAVRRVEGLTVNNGRVGPGGIIDEMGLVAADRTDRVTTTVEEKAPIANMGDQPPSLFRAREQAGALRTRLAAADLEMFLGPQVNLDVMKLGIIDNAEKPILAKAIVSAYTWASDVSAQVVIDGKQVHQQIGRTQAGEIYGLDLPDSPRIRLIKCASTGAAAIGEEVEFALRYDNIGDQPIGNVTIVDNLATRLEFVEGSAKSSRDADFSTSPNEGGSVVLRWEIKEPLPVGEGGVLRFKARVR